MFYSHIQLSNILEAVTEKERFMQNMRKQSTADTVHCSKLITAQTARLVLYPFSANSSAGTL